MGEPKLGKTGDIVWAFPQCYHIAAPGALKPIKQIVGIDLRPDRVRSDVTTVRGAIDALNAIPPNTTAVNVDDLTLITENTVRQYTQQGVSGFKLWGKVADDLMDLRQRVRNLGVHGFFTLHTKDPRYSETGALLETGGPQLPGRMKKGMPALADMILHAKKSTTLVSLWPVNYYNETEDASWSGVGLRELPPLRVLPANVGEILRAAGHKLHEPFANHEETVEKIAGHFERERAKMAELTKAYAPKLDAKFASGRPNSPWVYRTWILRDALARAQIRLAVADYRAVPVIYGGDDEEAL